MADLRSAMKEFRFLEDKRQGGPLSEIEEARFEELRGQLGVEAGAAPSGGFDVNAAAAQIYAGEAQPAPADPNAYPQGWDPNQPYDPNAAQQAYDPNAAQQPYDPN